MDQAKSAVPRTSHAAAPQGGIEKIIKAAIDRGASDLHIKAGDVFRARIDGKLVPLTKQRLTPEQTKAVALRLAATHDPAAPIHLPLARDRQPRPQGAGLREPEGTEVIRTEAASSRTQDAEATPATATPLPRINILREDYSHDHQGEHQWPGTEEPGGPE